MSQWNYFHRDCRQFAPVDVAKGICHRTGNMVHGDDESCSDFDRLPKCRWCARFTPDSDPKAAELGSCQATKPAFMAYADMAAVTCDDFQAVE